MRCIHYHTLLELILFAASALTVMKQAHEISPHHPRLTFAIAQILRDLRQWKGALAMYGTSLQLESSENYTHRARYAFVEPAAVLYNAVRIASRVCTCRIHSAMSNCFLSLKDRRSALLAAIQAVETDSKEPMCWMAKMHAERANGNIGAAIKDAHHIATLDPALGRDLPHVLQQLQAGTTAPTQASTVSAVR